MTSSDYKALAAAHLRISQIFTKEHELLESQKVRRAPRKPAVKKTVKKKAVKRGIKLKS